MKGSKPKKSKGGPSSMDRKKVGRNLARAYNQMGKAVGAYPRGR